MSELQILTRAELYELVWSRPVSTVAAEFGRTGPALLKTCRRYGVPTPPQGWWTREHHSMVQVRTPLPPASDDAPIIIYLGPKPSSGVARAMRAAARTAGREPSYPGHPHPFVSRLITRYRRGGIDQFGLVTRQGTRRGRRAVWLRVRRGSLSRLEAILGRLVSALEQVGAKFAEDEPGIVVRLDRQLVALRISEEMGGILRLELHPVNAQGFSREAPADARRVFEDGAVQLEAMVHDIAAATARLSPALPKRWPRPVSSGTGAAPLSPVPPIVEAMRPVAIGPFGSATASQSHFDKTGALFPPTDR